jgi:ribosomal protein S18 acetylase RimI-like enzyme
MAFRLREAGAADEAAILALHLASWRDAYREVLDPAFLAGPAGDRLGEHWRAVFAGPPRAGAVILAEAEDGPAGFAAAWLKGTRCYIDNLHVRPGLRGGGLGRALLGLAARRLAERGAESADLCVFAGNTAAIRFYRSLGAETGPERLEETFGQMVAEHEMRWPDIATLIAACSAEKPR